MLLWINYQVGCFERAGALKLNPTVESWRIMKKKRNTIGKLSTPRVIFNLPFLFSSFFFLNFERISKGTFSYIIGAIQLYVNEDTREIEH